MLEYRKRPLNNVELKVLLKIKSSCEKELKGKIKIHYYFIAALLGAVCAYVAFKIESDSWHFVLGTVGIFCLGFIVFTPYEIYKSVKRVKNIIRQVNELINSNEIKTALVNATRIAIAKEYEDEGDLYLIEISTGEILPLWDTEYNLNKSLPCLHFEVYDEKYSTIVGRVVNSLSEKIKATIIKSEDKWKYLKKYGAPAHLIIEDMSFDEIVERMQSVD